MLHAAYKESSSTWQRMNGKFMDFFYITQLTRRVEGAEKSEKRIILKPFYLFIDSINAENIMSVEIPCRVKGRNISDISPSEI